MSRAAFFRKFLIGLGVSALSIQQVHAYSSEWYWTNGFSGSYPTKSQAIANIHARASQDPRYALLTVESTMYISASSERIYLTGEPVEPVIGDWYYFNGNAAGPGGNFSSDSGLIDAWIAVAPGAPECGGTTMIGVGQWETVTIESFYGNTVSRERREYRRTIRGNTGGVCSTYEDYLTFLRQRPVSCPTWYAPGGPLKPGCKLNFSARILGVRNNCEEGCRDDGGNRGNPVQAMTGDKHETEVDYVGPDGLSLTRSYHTKSLDRRARMGAGWMTNYHRSIADD